MPHLHDKSSLFSEYEWTIQIGRCLGLQCLDEVAPEIEDLKAAAKSNGAVWCQGFERRGREGLIVFYPPRSMRCLDNFLHRFPPSAEGNPAEAAGVEGVRRRISFHELEADSNVRLLETTNRTTSRGINLHRLHIQNAESAGDLFERWMQCYGIRVQGQDRRAELAQELIRSSFEFAHWAAMEKGDVRYAPPLDHNHETGKRFQLYFSGRYSGSPAEMTFIACLDNCQPPYLHQKPVDATFRRPANHRKEILLASDAAGKIRFYLSRDAATRDGASIEMGFPESMKKLCLCAEAAGRELASISPVTP